MALRKIKYFRLLAFLTLVLCSPTHLWAAGPFVWCMGPHEYAVIENASIETHHNGHHHNLDLDHDQDHDPDVAGDGSNSTAQSHDDGEACLDLALAHDGQISLQNGSAFVPVFVELPAYFDIDQKRLPFDQDLMALSHAPPHQLVWPSRSLTIKSTIVLLI